MIGEFYVIENRDGGWVREEQRFSGNPLLWTRYSTELYARKALELVESDYWIEIKKYYEIV